MHMGPATQNGDWPQSTQLTPALSQPVRATLGQEFSGFLLFVLNTDFKYKQLKGKSRKSILLYYPGLGSTTQQNKKYYKCLERKELLTI